MYPKLRFKGFDDAWEQRKLSDIGNIITGSTPSTKDKNNYNGDFLFVSPADIQGNRFVEKTITTLSELGFKKGRILAPKSTLFVSIGSTIGKVAQIRDFAVTNQQINSIEPFKDIDPDFVFSLMQKESPSIRCLSATQAVPILNKTTFSNVEVSIASNINEQYRIGELFIKLDSTITLHQRQCEVLKKQKQFFLQNMFPKEGESEPRIRFNGFTEPWEQRKFKDFTKQTGIRNKENLDLEPYSITNETGFVPQKDAHDEFGYMKNTDRSAYSIVSPNSFAYNPARINVGSIGYYKGDKNVIVSSLYEVFQTDKDIDDSFLWIWFKSSNFFNWINKLQEGSVRQYFYYDKLCECKLPVPSLKEQEKIGTFFSKLDNLITLHQRQYEQLVSLKKYLLSKMFI